MSKITDFHELEVYRLAEDLADWIYDITGHFPTEEKYGLVSQLRRAAISIGGNIAEGFGRYFYKENKLHCYYARGSLLEVRSYVLFSHRRNLINQEQLAKFEKDYLCLKIKLNNYIASIGSGQQ
jgi:four helix bundle protein